MLSLLKGVDVKWFYIEMHEGKRNSDTLALYWIDGNTNEVK